MIHAEPSLPSLPSLPTVARAAGFRNACLRAPALAWERTPAWTVTAILGLAYVLAAPSSADLAAASYRSWLFSRYGLLAWENGWYAGHELIGYSLLAPALGALLGVRAAAALAAIAAAALFSALIGDRAPTRSATSTDRALRLASIWFAAIVGVQLLCGRVPTDIGAAFALGSLLAAQRRYRSIAALLALLSSLSSPVAGALLALCLLAWALAGGGRGRAERLWALTLAGVALFPIGVLGLAFPTVGSEPFAADSFWLSLAGTIALALALRSLPLLRSGALLYALALVGAYVVPSAMGGNVERLATLAAGPLAALSLGRKRPLLLLALAPALLYWQLNDPVGDLTSALGDPAVGASYYRPLMAELAARDRGNLPLRIEVVPTRDHWEARWVPQRFTIARGWERQLDEAQNQLFYRPGPLDPARYRAWLERNAVSYVALPDAPLDDAGLAEATLLRTAAPAYLREVWRSRQWRLFRVLEATPLVSAPAHMTALGPDSFTIRAPSAGTFLVRIHFSPYWALESGVGCVARSAGGLTQLRLRAPGAIRVGIAFSLGRVLASGPRCTPS